MLNIAVFLLFATWLSALGSTTDSHLPINVLAHWRKIPAEAPESIRNEKQLASYKDFISPVLMGGLGNVLFQLATAHAAARDFHTACIVAWWDQDKAEDVYLPYGGRGDPVPGISLKHIFPNILYADFKPKYRGVVDAAYHYPTLDTFTPFPADLPSIHYTFGYYFHPGFWHHQRPYLVNHVFQFHPAMVSYVTHKYAAFLESSRELVSVHFRLGGASEPRTLMGRNYPSASWYKTVLMHEFNPSTATFLMFTDNTEAMLQMIEGFSNGSLSYHVVDEDFANSLLLMSLCKHHVGTASTFSFWGAYLDRNQPTGGRTIFPPQFRSPNMHGNIPWPFDNWEIVGDDEYVAPLAAQSQRESGWLPECKVISHCVAFLFMLACALLFYSVRLRRGLRLFIFSTSEYLPRAKSLFLGRHADSSVMDLDSTRVDVGIVA